MNVQVHLSQKALELAVLQLELAQSLGLCRIHAAVEKPRLRLISLTGMPDSACLKKPMICSSLYLLVLMSIILRIDGLLGKMKATAYGEQVS